MRRVVKFHILEVALRVVEKDAVFYVFINSDFVSYGVVLHGSYLEDAHVDTSHLLFKLQSHNILRKESIGRISGAVDLERRFGRACFVGGRFEGGEDVKARIFGKGSLQNLNSEIVARQQDDVVVSGQSRFSYQSHFREVFDVQIIIDDTVVGSGRSSKTIEMIFNGQGGDVALYY